MREIAQVPQDEYTRGERPSHVHSRGKQCAGGHFNPGNTMYGGPEDKERHVGDLGNIEADKSGRAKYNRLDAQISMHGRNSIIGRSIVIKEKADDYKTQPGGEELGSASRTESSAFPHFRLIKRHPGYT